MRRWPLLRNRDFMLLWSGEALSELGSQTSTVAYPLLVLALTGSAAKAGVVGLAKWLPLALFALPAGVLADRLNRKQLMIACDALRMVAAASVVVALWLGRPPYLQIVVVAFLDGGLFMTSYICERGALGQVVPTDQLESAVTQNEARTFGAGIVGPPLGGLLFAITRSLPFVADTGSFLCSMTAISLTRSKFQSPRAAEESGPGGVWRHAAEGLGWLWREPFFRTTSLLFAAGNPVFTGLYLLAILLAKHHGASSAAVGAMFALVGAGGVLGAVAAGPLRKRMTTRTLIAGQQWLIVLATLLLLTTPSAVVIGLLVSPSAWLSSTPDQRPPSLSSLDGRSHSPSSRPPPQRSGTALERVVPVSCASEEGGRGSTGQASAAPRMQRPPTSTSELRAFPARPERSHWMFRTRFQPAGEEPPLRASLSSGVGSRSLSSSVLTAVASTVLGSVSRIRCSSPMAVSIS